MKLLINGTETEVPPTCLHVAALLTHLDLGYPVLVELNGTALFPRELPSVPIQDGDRIELMRMVAGG